MTDHETPEKRETTTAHPESDALIYDIDNPPKSWQEAYKLSRRLESERNEAREALRGLQIYAGLMEAFAERENRPDLRVMNPEDARRLAKKIRDANKSFSQNGGVQ